MSRTAPPCSPRVSLPLPLVRLVRQVDLDLDGAATSSLLRVSDDPLRVANLPLHTDHPLVALMGFVAPPDWLAIGVHCLGRAHALGEAPDGPAGGCTTVAVDAEPTPVAVTVLVDRHGRGAGLVRHGTTSLQLDGAPEGAVGDACRRALGLPTAAAPVSTAELWLRVWLDRVVETVTFADRPDDLLTWAAVAALHPAARGDVATVAADDGPLVLDEPEALAEATHVLAEAWPWSRLRRDPEVVDTSNPPLRPSVTAWMDDGMFARCVLGELAPLPLLLRTIRALLPPSTLDAIEDSILATGLTIRESADSVTPAGAENGQ